jgi:hypothetical protein
VAIDLSNATRKVEEFMTETVQVYAPDAVHQSTVDPVTLALTYPASLKLYDGACKLKDVTTTSRGRGTGDSIGGELVLMVVTKIDFPIGDVPDAGFPEGAIITCTDALRMPQLVGAEYKMRQSVLKTFGIQYTILADRIKPVDP